ncbi:transposable element Tcb1 transposase [Trichonephila clavipes]|nr:transposable element Tcb1 transposase [Trichonephila clavipes]
MARINHLDDFTRGRMIGKLEEGRIVTSVAAEFGINKSVVSCAWKSFQTTGTAVRKVGGGRPRTATAGDDRYIILKSVTEDRYYEDELLPHVRLFRGAIASDFLFMDDNAQPHQTLAVEDLLEREAITRMNWPAYSPDLNPIEHVWDALGRHIAARLLHPENTQQLKKMLIKEWALLPQEILHHLVLSMPRRCKATIAMRGGHIPY